MPIALVRGRDAKGAFYRLGKDGTKYHYAAGNAKSRAAARNRALRQAQRMEMGLLRAR